MLTFTTGRRAAVRAGLAFHNSSLTAEERTVVEEAFHVVHCVNVEGRRWLRADLRGELAAAHHGHPCVAGLVFRAHELEPLRGRLPQHLPHTGSARVKLQMRRFEVARHPTRRTWRLRP